MEVSMPTGSLCAERNVIGSALADDITLTRKDLKVIAVYSAIIPTANISEVRDTNNDSVCQPCDITEDHTNRSPVVGGKRKIMNMSRNGEPKQLSSENGSLSEFFNMSFSP